MRSYDEFLARTLCHGGDGGDGGGGSFGSNYGGSNYFDADAYNAGLDVGPQGQNFSFSDAPGGFDGMGDASLTDATKAVSTPFKDDFGARAARAVGNTFLGFVGLNNPGPQSFGAGTRASTGYGFNPGALAGSYLGLATGVPGLNALGASAWNNMQAPSAPQSFQSKENAPAPTSFSPFAQYNPNPYPDPYSQYDSTLQERLRAAGVNV